MSSPIRFLARRQVEARFERLRPMLQAASVPDGGWMRTLRTALGMRQADLAVRMGVSRQAVSDLERREQEGGATLKALREAALALDAELVYAIVPRRSVGETLEHRAMRIAGRITGSVRHSMRLEDQEPASDLDERTREVARQLLEHPGRLWAAPDADG
jgi:predicted DNA-binding mobile mystery protein A